MRADQLTLVDDREERPPPPAEGGRKRKGGSGGEQSSREQDAEQLQAEGEVSEAERASRRETVFEKPRHRSATQAGASLLPEAAEPMLGAEPVPEAGAQAASDDVDDVGDVDAASVASKSAAAAADEYPACRNGHALKASTLCGAAGEPDTCDACSRELQYGATAFSCANPSCRINHSGCNPKQ